jgi:glycerol-3-phosphate dehydrogenase (NAD(P)+)
VGKSHIAIVGGGAWGTALAQACAAPGGRRVTLWAREPDVVNQINAGHENKIFLPGVMLLPAISATARLGDVAGADLTLLVCPAQHLRSIVRALRAEIGRDATVLICAKGIERDSGKLMTEVARDEAGDLRFGMLSGPSFAAEVARGLPCAVTLALDDAAAAEEAARQINSSMVRPYASTDVTGVAIGGAVKNVLAIACGVVEGRGFGESARAALTTRGFAEMTRFGVALGARLETMGGLSGLGGRAGSRGIFP